MQLVSRAYSLKSAAAILVATGSDCTTIEMGDGNNGGMARIGAFSSVETAQASARRACGLSETSDFDPIALSPYLPAITHTVHFFKCSEPAKDIQ